MKPCRYVHFNMHMLNVSQPLYCSPKLSEVKTIFKEKQALVNVFMNTKGDFDRVVYEYMEAILKRVGVFFYPQGRSYFRGCTGSGDPEIPSLLVLEAYVAHFSMCQPIFLLHSLLSEARAEWLVANQSYYADSGYRRPSSLKQLTQACGALSGSTFHSLATRGNIMKKNNKNQNQPTLETVPEAVSNLPLPAEVAPEATSHTLSPGNTTQEVVMPTSLPSPQQSASGTQEVPMHTEAPIHGKALSEEGSTSAEEAKAFQDIEDQLLNSPGTPVSTGTLDDATEQLGNLRMKRPNLTTAQSREALKAKLLEKGEAFDPSTWRRGEKKKKNKERQEVSTPGPTAGTKAREGSAKRPRGTLATPPSAEGPAKKARRETQKSEAHDPEASGSTSKATYREVAAIKMAIALDGYPDAKLSEEQGEAIEDAIMEEIQPLEDGSVPSFAGTYLEKGVLIASCINEHTKRWLEEVIQRTKPLGDDISLRVQTHHTTPTKTPKVENPSIQARSERLRIRLFPGRGLLQGCEGFQL
ncbi:hypothetical protein J6590_067833 [Homalodisca vitripennis]|nr:hypothetical protein J6590_067833 [Homalodisca vitripennis]